MAELNIHIHDDDEQQQSLWTKTVCFKNDQQHVVVIMVN